MPTISSLISNLKTHLFKSPKPSIFNPLPPPSFTTLPNIITRVSSQHPKPSIQATEEKNGVSIHGFRDTMLEKLKTEEKNDDFRGTMLEKMKIQEKNDGFGDTIFEKLKIEEKNDGFRDTMLEEVKIEEKNDGFSDTIVEKLEVDNNNGNCNRDSRVANLKKLEISDAGNGDGLPGKPKNGSGDEGYDAIFKEMKENGLVPNAVAMIDGLCKDGLSDEAMKLFRLMREEGTIPEVVIYTAVVDGFCKLGKFDDAMRIFRKMERKEVVPNAYSYSVLVQGLCGGGRLEGSVGMCYEMVEAGHSLNAATFTELVRALCEKELEEAETDLNEAERVVRRLREKGYAVDEKDVREYMKKKGPFSLKVSEAIFGKQRWTASQKYNCSRLVVRKST